MFTRQFVPTEPRLSVRQVAQRIGEISTLPHIAMRVLQIANDPDSSVRDLKEIMEGDAALSTRVLRCVNSSAYGLRTKITNLQQAIAYLGMKQIRNLATTASVSELFRIEENIGPYRRTELWRHLVSVGVCARLLAMRMRFANFEDVFLAGLLHDIGIILEDQHLHKEFVQVMHSLEEGKTLGEVEVEHLGFDHTQLAEEVGRSWRFPEAVLAAVRYHHNSAACRDEHAGIVRCVEVANLICSLKGISSVGINLVAFPKSAIVELALTKNDVTVLANDLDRELEANQRLFQM